MKKTDLAINVGKVGLIALAIGTGALAGKYTNERAAEKKSDYPQTFLERYYTQDGKDYAQLKQYYEFGNQSMPGSHIAVQYWSVPSNSVPNYAEGQRIR
jgi:hypothetical protein